MNKIYIFLITTCLLSACATTNTHKQKEKIVTIQQLDTGIVKLLTAADFKPPVTCDLINNDTEITKKDGSTELLKDYLSGKVNASYFLLYIGGYRTSEKDPSKRYDWVETEAVNICSKNKNLLYVEAIKLAMELSRTNKEFLN